MRMTLKVKFMVLGFILTIASSGFLGFFFMSHEARVLKLELDDKMDGIARNFALNCEYGVLASNKAELARLGDNLLRQNEIVAVSIRNAGGAVLVDLKKNTAPGRMKEFAAQILGEKLNESGGEDVILDFMQNTGNEVIGNIVLTASLDPLYRRIRELRGSLAIMISVIAIVVMVCVIVIVNKFVGKPINNLISATQKIAQGDLNYKVQIKSKDEIGALAEFFNDMTRDLSATLVSKNYVNNIIASMIDALIVVDLDGNIMTVNQATADLLGFGENELKGREIGFILATRQRLSMNDLKYLSGKSITIIKNFETKFKNRDGQAVPVLINISAMKDKDGAVTGFIYSARDITKHKETEMALEKSEIRYRILAENATDVIWALDTDMRVTYMSPSVLSLTGYRAEEMIGKDLENIVQKGCYPQMKKVFGIVLLGDTGTELSRTVEMEIVKKNAAPVWAESRVSPLRGAGGNITGLLGVTRDISERKNLEKQLFQFQKMEAIGRLAGGIAHDFNNLLTPILGFSDLCLREIDSKEKVVENLKEIKSASQRAKALVGQLLAFGRKQILQPKIINLNGVLGKTEVLLRRVIGEDIDLAISLAPDLGNIRIDEVQLEQIIMNLSVNARDAMPQGGKLAITTANVYLGEKETWQSMDLKPGNYVALSITDNGVGMDDETKAHIFEPFFSTKKEKGNGLGLATVYGIVKQSGGHIVVSSEKDKGTAFRVFFPNVLEDASRAEEQKTVHHETLEGSETILLVEDEKGVRNVIQQILRSYKYNVIEAENGEKAVDILKNFAGNIHLLITDIVMPGGMGGRMVGERAKELRKNIKVLFISGYAENTIVHQGVLESGLDFMQKPFDPKSLVLKVRDLMENT